MPKIRLDEGGSTCYVYLVFTRTSTNKNKACDSLEVISEAIEVIYAFWVNAEPSEVMGAWIVALISDEKWMDKDLEHPGLRHCCFNCCISGCSEQRSVRIGDCFDGRFISGEPVQRHPGIPGKQQDGSNSVGIDPSTFRSHAV